jgi:SAM-dependent methyltransferase
MDLGRLKVLVVIASYGVKNLRFLKQIIQTYRALPFQVDLVVVSEAEKDLGPDVKVVVGLPSSNTWSLPFAHKAVFARAVDQYDLFVYSEDDIGVEEHHIRAFLDATKSLNDDEIAGFLHYEVNATGQRVLNGAWAHYHWLPESVRRRGRYTVAEFTNEHAGFYILTQDQLRRAIASGGFMLGPREGRYQLPETAATDPYTVCGFRKVVCVSHIEDFLIHHLPDCYFAGLEVSLPSLKEQIQTLMNICAGAHPSTTLCEVESKSWPNGWPKHYYEKASDAVLRMVPSDARTILSVGCGSGHLEAKLQGRGAAVTAVPLDSVIGEVAERRGMRVVYGTWPDWVRTLADESFDCVVMLNLLHLHSSPERLILDLGRFVGRGGSLVLGGPNFNRLPWLIKRILNLDDYGKLRHFELSGHNICGPRSLAPSIAECNLQVEKVEWHDHAFNRTGLRGKPLRLGSLTAKNWLIRARRPHGAR